MQTEGLTFIEAVEALKEGRCEGIKRPQMDVKIVCVPIKYGENAGNILAWAGYDTLFMDIDFYSATDWILVDPTPQFEEVEVVRWLTLLPKNDTYTSKTEAEAQVLAERHGGVVVKVVGTYCREIPTKVKRREEIHRDCCSINSKNIPFGAKFYAEWEE